jgi:hypothetical protein
MAPAGVINHVFVSPMLPDIIIFPGYRSANPRRTQNRHQARCQAQSPHDQTFTAHAG